jgi:hypothetical protein
VLGNYIPGHPQKRNLYIWGANDFEQQGHSESRRQLLPTLFKGGKFKIPVNRWRDIFSWIFLGRTSPGSIFLEFPSEIIFHMAGLLSPCNKKIKIVLYFTNQVEWYLLYRSETKKYYQDLSGDAYNKINWLDRG